MLHIGRCTLAATMDLTERKITKIAREASKLAVRTLKEDGIYFKKLKLVEKSTSYLIA